VPIIDVLGRKLGRSLKGTGGKLHAVVLLKAALQTLEDFDGLLHGGLHHINLLEATRQRSVFLEDAAILCKGRSANALERAVRQRRFEQV
jgi:hypothetical protein